MSVHHVSAGRHVPEEFNVIIEIPMNADPVKYEIDKESGALFVDRFMMTAMHYPANYGYVPETIADDDDPVDVLVQSAIGQRCPSWSENGRRVGTTLGVMFQHTRDGRKRHRASRICKSFGCHLCVCVRLLTTSGPVQPRVYFTLTASSRHR